MARDATVDFMIEPTTEELNALQGETRLILDNAVNWEDVAECDRARAEEWIWKWRWEQARRSLL